MLPANGKLAKNIRSSDKKEMHIGVAVQTQQKMALKTIIQQNLSLQNQT